MALIAAGEVAVCPKQRFNGFEGLALTMAIRPQPWSDPRYAIPLAGIILGTVLNAGIITLPSIMRGQILAGMDPVGAVKYKVLLMFLIAGASGIAALTVASLALRRLIDDRQRLRLDRLMT